MGNAVVLNVYPDRSLILLTESGDLVTLPSKDVVKDYYTLSEAYLHHVKHGEPLPSIPERIEEQIQLLESALVYVNKKGVK